MKLEKETPREKSIEEEEEGDTTQVVWTRRKNKEEINKNKLHLKIPK